MADASEEPALHRISFAQRHGRAFGRHAHRRLHASTPENSVLTMATEETDSSRSAKRIKLRQEERPRSGPVPTAAPRIERRVFDIIVEESTTTDHFLIKVLPTAPEVLTGGGATLTIPAFSLGTPLAFPPPPAGSTTLPSLGLVSPSSSLAPISSNLPSSLLPTPSTSQTVQTLSTSSSTITPSLRNPLGNSTATASPSLNMSTLRGDWGTNATAAIAASTGTQLTSFATSFSSTQTHKPTTHTTTPFFQPSAFTPGVDPVPTPASGTAPASATSTTAAAMAAASTAPIVVPVVSGVVGGLAGLTVILLLVLFIFRWRQRRTQGVRLADDGVSALPPGTANSEAALVQSRPLTNSWPTSGFIPFVHRLRPISLTGITASPATQQTSEKGFQNLGGRRIQSVLSTNGDGYGDIAFGTASNNNSRATNIDDANPRSPHLPRNPFIDPPPTTNGWDHGHAFSGVPVQYARAQPDNPFNDPSSSQGGHSYDSPAPLGLGLDGRASMQDERQRQRRGPGGTAAAVAAAAATQQQPRSGPEVAQMRPGAQRGVIVNDVGLGPLGAIGQDRRQGGGSRTPTGTRTPPRMMPLNTAPPGARGRGVGNEPPPPRIVEYTGP